jgi:hypothetical protein
VTIEHRYQVVASASSDQVIPLRRDTRSVDSVSNPPTGNLKGLQDVMRAGKGWAPAESAEQVLEHLGRLQSPLPETRHTHQHPGLVKVVQRDINDTVTAATGDVQIVVGSDLDIGIQVNGELRAAAPGARYLGSRQIDFIMYSRTNAGDHSM